MIKFIQEINSCSGEKLFLPNGVAVLDGGSIVVADGGNDRVCLLDSNGNALKSIGGKGFGKYRFKEPVGVFVSPDQKIYVPDWHNHRVVVYDKDLKYLGEFGHYGKLESTSFLAGNIRGVLRFLKSLAYTGSYARHHFASVSQKGSESKRFSLQLLLKGLAYWYKRNTSLSAAVRMMFSTYDAINKPNGVAFYQDRIVVSQKNSRCLSVYYRDRDSHTYVPVTHYLGPTSNGKFGRLGNIAYDTQGFLYVCDERENVIWKLNTDFQLVDAIIGQNSGTGEFLPFSCCHIDDNTLVVCGGLNFQIIDLSDNEVVYCSEDIGELHGVAYDKKRDKLYVVNRSKGAIHVYKIVDTCRR